MAERAIVHVWCVDAILLLGRSEAEVAHQTAVVVDPMTEMDAQVNFDKSTKTPSQQVVYLGPRLDLLNDRILTEIVLPHPNPNPNPNPQSFPLPLMSRDDIGMG